MNEEVIRETMSLCPECLKQIPAQFYVDPQTNWVMLRKTCEEHGEFKDKISIDADEYKWQMKFTNDIGSTDEKISTKPVEVSSGIRKAKNGCPYDCGICENHKSAPCICLIDVTNRCNLACPICFANASAKGYVVEPTFDEIVYIMKHFRSMKPTPAVLLQFAGGEPTLRDDLPEITKIGKELGFLDIMVSTNGIRIAKSIEYLQALKDAGLDTVYLQFDATDAPEIWKKVRGVNLWPIKQKAVENVRKVGDITLMLVPVIAKGVNDSQVGPIMEFAKANKDVCGGIVFQPVSLCGRISFEELMDLRYTTSDLKRDINKATNNVIQKFYPLATSSKFTKLLAWFDAAPHWAATSHHDCGFATIGIVNKNSEWEPIENYIDVEGLLKWSNKVYDMIQSRTVPKPTSILGNFNLSDYGAVAETVGKFIDDMTNLGYRQMMKAYYFAGLIKHVKVKKVLESTVIESLAKLVAAPNMRTSGNFLLSGNMLISAMHFQDAYNFDLNRVKSCLVHYGIIDPADPKRVLEVPFCAMNTVHRERLELAHALKDEKTEKPEVITERVSKYIESIEK
ncbi:MAG: radical SAM protein [Candidatus Lokiarchaeota archaeon]|nr:radical SAM protein [Candidatus Lokiarchaeota archaeon]MBD3342583.1 radical SAM protein [Candidatus Lokiarchaeota archaeon]